MRIVQLSAITALMCTLLACSRAPEPAGFDDISAPQALTEHSGEFTEEIVRVTDNVYVAIGYGLANSIMIEGDDGVIIVDTMATLEQGRRVRSAFRAVVDKPVKAIIYTHNHTDHVFGAQAFVDPGETPRVYAHATTMNYVKRIVTEYRPIITARSFRMFGILLDDAALINNGIGPRLGIDENSEFGIVTPTHTVVDELEDEIAGVRFKLVHAPGETNDQIFVWLPATRTLLPGDNLYKAFPNLYTIRGTPYRSLKQWASSIDTMRALRPQHIVPSHTRPRSGADDIQRVLTNYRDAIRYVHDQTVRGINQGLTPDELVERVRLPEHLAGEPYLQEFYGKVSWSVRAVFAGNLGWFDGNPSTLEPLPPQQTAEHMARLAGGPAALRQAVLDAVAGGEFQWALQLGDHAGRLLPDDAALRQARIDALTALGQAQANPNARHYYLTRALELRDDLSIRQVSSSNDELLRQLPLQNFFEAMVVNLRAEDCLDMDLRAGFSFPDTGEHFTLWIRRGVAELQPSLLDDLDLHTAIDSLAFKRMLARVTRPAVAIARDFEMRRGNTLDLARVLALFRPAAQ